MSPLPGLNSSVFSGGLVLFFRQLTELSMQRAILSGFLIAAGATGSSAFAADPVPETGSWYIDPMLQYTSLDDRRISKDDFGYQVGIGNNIAPNVALEFNYGNGSYKVKGFEGSNGPSEKLRALSLDMLFKFLPGRMFDPYVLEGGGELQDTIGGFPNHRAWLAEAGVGVLTGLGPQTGSVRLQLRTEAKYRWEFIQHAAYIPKGPDDIVYGVGLQLSFGNPTAPLALVAAAPPPPAPPPPAPPPPPPPAPCSPPAGFQVDANCQIIEQTLVVRAVDFEYNSTRLTVPAQQTLNDVAKALAAQPALNVEIQGYTDSIGSAAYNLDLSQRRADSVRAYLVDKGVSGSALTAKGYGKTSPIASNDTAEGRAQNRRVAFAVSNAPAHIKVVTEDATAASTEAAKQGPQPSKSKLEQPQ
jgi:OmpA-OmpF porin, OOP family